MANIVFNIAKGRGNELYRRVENADPATCALIVVPIETAGLESDSVLRVARTLAAVLSGTTNEQTTMGRRVLTAAELASFPVPDDVNNWLETALPTVTWPGATGNPISKMLVCYRNATADADSAIVPLAMFDYVATPSGTSIEIGAGGFFRAA